MKVYISGPITGHEDTADERFEAGEAVVREMGHEPLNPMKLDFPSVNGAPEWKDYMKRDLAELMDCDGIYMLKRWRESKGARVEFAVAAQMNLKIMFEDVVEAKRQESLAGKGSES